jgi:hypothetical protein
MGAEIARGVRTGKLYRDDQILIPEKYDEMKAEPLIVDDDKLVVPVRNRDRPHFRVISAGNYLDRIGITDPDPTHNVCVAELLDKILQSPLRILTRVFAEEKESGEQVIFEEPSSRRYLWGSESQVRIPVGYGRYIQPDIAGRDTTFFHANVYRPSIIIEVIRTHPPDFETFRCLLRLSTQGHIVIFFFIPRGGKHSQYNHVKEQDDVLEIRSAYYFSGGEVWKNGDKDKWRPWAGATETAWYQYLITHYWGFAMKNV